MSILNHKTPARLAPLEHDADTIRGFDPRDLEEWQRMLRDGWTLKSCRVTPNDVARCIETLDREHHDRPETPTGGIMALEREKRILAMVRLMPFPAHTEIRNARMFRKEHTLELLKLVVLAVSQCIGSGLKLITIGEDVGPDHAKLIAQGLRLKFTLRGTVHSIHP